ncbi:hypothetical protein [Shinella zoogloeoides]|uniref:hypothetical protein n=1 Tax=Shinella zoogloeoides TaxID=352475 RepID=UPI00299CF41D|nr:hypothetical protein [Shinella zoogloeoides]WPE19853.1 hypothetical protein ShzoTeo12_10290 [Shinella zoogloeoides]
MKLKLRNLKKGDHLEVRFRTHDNSIWHPAEVDQINADFIWARYASGHVRKIPRDKHEDYRLSPVKAYA